MTDRRQIADELWAAFKHWDGEKKFALTRHKETSHWERRHE
jgi:hypothetical protein